MLQDFLQLLESNIATLSPAHVILLIAGLSLIQEDAVLLFSAALVARGVVSFEVAFWGNSLGVILGDFALYGVGMWLARYRDRWVWVSRIFKPGRVELGQRLFAKLGFWIVILSKFTPAIRTPLYLSMGFMRSGFVSFSLAIALSGMLWIWFILEGVVKAEELGVLPLAIALLILGILLAQILSWRWQKRMK